MEVDTENILIRAIGDDNKEELCDILESLKSKQITSEDFQVYKTQINRALYVSIQTGKVESVKILLKEGADPSDLGDFHKRSILAVAVSSGSLDVVKLLHSAEMSTDDIIDAVTEAGDQKRMDMLTVFLGEDLPQGIKKLEDQGKTPLVQACELKTKDCVEYLLDVGFDVNASGAGGQTALHAAAAAGDTDLVTLLVDRGANLFALCDTGLPFTMAVESGHEELAEEKLVPADDIDSPDPSPKSSEHEEYTMLMYACVVGSAQSVDMLLDELGADPEKEAKGYQVIKSALRGGNHDVIENILSRISVNATSCWDLTPFQCALMMRYSEDERTPDEEILALLLEAGADIDDPFMWEEMVTPLMVAAESADDQAVTWLLQHGADPNYVLTPSNKTPLWCAVSGGSREAVRTVLGHNPDMFLTSLSVSCVYAPGHTTLHEALLREDMKLVRALVSSGCSLTGLQDPRDNYGKLRNDKTVMQLFERSCQPRELQEICKLTVKNTLGHVDVDEKIEKLPVPKHIRDLLCSGYVKPIFLTNDTYDDSDDATDSDSGTGSNSDGNTEDRDISATINNADL